jgi:hypothetical protein
VNIPILPLLKSSAKLAKKRVMAKNGTQKMWCAIQKSSIFYESKAPCGSFATWGLQNMEIPEGVRNF